MNIDILTVDLNFTGGMCPFLNIFRIMNAVKCQSTILMMKYVFKNSYE